MTQNPTGDRANDVEWHIHRRLYQELNPVKDRVTTINGTASIARTPRSPQECKRRRMAHPSLIVPIRTNPVKDRATTINDTASIARIPRSPQEGKCCRMAHPSKIVPQRTKQQPQINSTPKSQLSKTAPGAGFFRHQPPPQ